MARIKLSKPRERGFRRALLSLVLKFKKCKNRPYSEFFWRPHPIKLHKSAKCSEKQLVLNDFQAPLCLPFRNMV